MSSSGIPSMVSKNISQPSSRASSGATSTASYRSRRSVVNTALVLSGLGSGHSFDLNTKQGQVYDNVPGKMGSVTYEAFCTDCTLVTINYCQRALEQVAEITAQGLQAASGRSNVSAAQVQKIQEMRGLINHDYLVLELESPGFGKQYILAEKVTEYTEKDERRPQVGIYIEPLNTSVIDSFLHKDVHLYEMPCTTKIKLREIEDILKTATDAHYNLKDNNCWDYAFAATLRLLYRCMTCVGTTSPAYTELKRMHDNLAAELNKKEIKATLRTVWNNVISS